MKAGWWDAPFTLQDLAEEIHIINFHTWNSQRSHRCRIQEWSYWYSFIVFKALGSFKFWGFSVHSLAAGVRGPGFVVRCSASKTSRVCPQYSPFDENNLVSFHLWRREILLKLEKVFTDFAKDYETIFSSSIGDFSFLFQPFWKETEVLVSGNFVRKLSQKFQEL